MKALISRWGTDLALRLPAAAVETLDLREGEAVELSIVANRIEIRALRPRYRLEELVAQITAENQPEVVELRPRGEEAL